MRWFPFLVRTLCLQSMGSVRALGTQGSPDYALHLMSDSHAPLSYWHDIALPRALLDGEAVIPFVLEIPKG